MDFYRISEHAGKNGIVEIFPSFQVVRSGDLMIRGKEFYAIWNDETGLWSTDEYDVARLVDKTLWEHKENWKPNERASICKVKTMNNFSTNVWLNYRSYVGKLTDSYHQLDKKLTFANTVVKKEDYVSKRLPYSLEPGSIAAYEELIGTLYAPEEKAKLEWGIGAIISGDSRTIQKFLVLYGEGGTGKSTWINIVEKLFDGYTATFEADALTSKNNQFALESFRANPLVAIQHDGDLSQIADNSKLNAIVGHDIMRFNEKFKPTYDAKNEAFLIMGTNKPVKITDAKSGIIRRLIDVHPTGKRVSPRKYQTLTSQIDFELGAIAHHCLEVYREMGRDYYSGYKAVEMMLQTNAFYNYIENFFDIFKEQDGTTLKAAYDMYLEFCEESNIEFPFPKLKFRDELANYFSKFEERAQINGARVRSWYSGFKSEHFTVQLKEPNMFSLVLDETESIFDLEFAGAQAQYAKESGTPAEKWDNVDTVLSNLETHKLHYVRPDIQHIVIDFDLKGDDGQKSAERNLEAASKWPPTYAEYSKGGQGIHLHYNYDGDVSELAALHADDIEVKVFKGHSSLRRKLSKCNNVPIATLRGGLKLKEKKVINQDVVENERTLRNSIIKALKKEVHPDTTSNMNFIHKLLKDAYSAGVPYDVTDLRPKIQAFANNSTNQALYCIKLMMDMPFASETTVEEVAPEAAELKHGEERPIVFYDVEVFPNLFIICWKFEGSDQVVRMINPSAQAVEELFQHKLVGFNNRKYDNHILYGAHMGYSLEQLYSLSQKIVSNEPNAMFAGAYDLSYADIFDFSSKKQGLKKFQIELGIHHMELGLPWDEPVPPEKWDLVAEYCANDVISTEKVFEDRRDDFTARQILADLSGLTVMATTQKHTAKIVFGDNRKAQDEFKYTNLATKFPGYKYDFTEVEGANGRMKTIKASTYRGETVGEGGYVYAEPGIYYDVAILDIASMHPTSIGILDAFGPYTKNFLDLLRARVAIKRGEYDVARQMLGGKLAPYLKDESNAEKLSYALKIVINIVYGLTAASFDNPFRDRRNKDNIVAKIGSLYMVDLKNAVQEKGFIVVHIKTDSIKIANATPEIIEFVMEHGANFGYEFEHEGTYEKICLVNDAVYVGYKKAGKKPAHWETTGAQFQHPYVKKFLFTKEPILFRDKCETKTVTSALYLDFNEPILEEDTPMALDEGKDTLHFVGKAGSFCPMVPGAGGGELLRRKDDRYSAAAGSKGFRWMEAEMVEQLEKKDDIDLGYFRKLVDAAKENIGRFGDFEQFVDIHEEEKVAE